MFCLKVVLLAANAPVAKGGGLEHFMRKMCPPLGFLYLISFTKKYFPDHVDFVISDNLNNIDLHSENSPDIIGISSVTESFSYATELARHIKNSNSTIPVIAGGAHISAIPSELPDEFDIGVIGEGEATFLELLGLYRDNGSFSVKDLFNIEGICFHNDCGEVTVNPARNPLENLDIIPVPDRKLISPGSITHIITSRGCKFKCFFCSTPGVWKNYRTHSPGYVVQEIKEACNILKNSYVIFFDDLFISDRLRIKAISDKLSEEGLADKFEFFAYGRTEFIDEPVIKELKRLNTVEISLGTQSGVTMESAENDGFSYHQRAVDLCNEYGIKLSLSFMIGLPNEREEDLRKIYNFLEHNRGKLHSVQISPLRPFPGTPLWEYAKSRGFVRDNLKDWSVVKSFTLFFDFDPDSYIYLNEYMDFSIFKQYCNEFKYILKDWKS